MASPPAQKILATTNDGVLPLDLLHDILLGVPVKSLCRYRAVCKSWRSLLCHPDFIAAHTARHPARLLLAVGCAADENSEWSVNLVDVSGNIVKRLPSAYVNSCGHPFSLRTHRDLVYEDVELCMLDPATDAVFSDLPPRHGYPSTSALGWVASTREYKVLNIITYLHPQVCKVLTVGDNETWREIGSPPARVGRGSTDVAVVKGVVYWLVAAIERRDWTSGIGLQDWIVAFDLKTEAWRRTPASIRGPIQRSDVPIIVFMTELNDNLVVVVKELEEPCDATLWFLMDDPDKEVLWCKRYTITIPTIPIDGLRFQEPLHLLDDGRIAVCMYRGLPGNRCCNEVWIYDPTTKTMTDRALTTPKCCVVDVYKGCLLRSGSGKFF